MTPSASSFEEIQVHLLFRQDWNLHVNRAHYDEISFEQKVRMQVKDVLI